jgi:hypothetical protein
MRPALEYTFDMPATYRIVIQGALEKTWFKDLYDLEIVVDQLTGGVQETTLKGEMNDQAALMGMLNTLYNMGYVLLHLERMAKN